MYKILQIRYVYDIEIVYNVRLLYLALGTGNAALQLTAPLKELASSSLNLIKYHEESDRYITIKYILLNFIKFY